MANEEKGFQKNIIHWASRIYAKPSLNSYKIRKLKK